MQNIQKISKQKTTTIHLEGYTLQVEYEIVVMAHTHSGIYGYAKPAEITIHNGESDISHQINLTEST